MARPIANSSQIDWIGSTAELLSFVAFFEGLPVAIKMVFGRETQLPKPGRLFMAVCVLYVTMYLTVSSLRIVIDWLVYPRMPQFIEGMEPSLVDPFEKGLATALGEKLVWSRANDWAQLGYLCLPILVISWSFASPSTGTKPARANSTEWLGRFLLIVFPLAAVLHEAFRPGMR